MRNKNGFTLIELLVAIGIVSVLAAVVLASVGSYRKEARGAKLLGSLNSVITSMQSCWTIADGDVRSPSSGKNICTLVSQSNADQYDKWPDLSQIGSGYSYLNNNCAMGNCKLGFLPSDGFEKNYAYDSGFFIKKAQAQSVPPPMKSKCFPRSGWYFSAGSDASHDNIKVCCNSAMKGCKVIDFATNCDLSIN